MRVLGSSRYSHPRGEPREGSMPSGGTEGFRREEGADTEVLTNDLHKSTAASQATWAKGLATQGPSHPRGHFVGE